MMKQITVYEKRTVKHMGLVRPTLLCLKEELHAYLSKTFPNVKFTIKLKRNYKKTFFVKKQRKSSLVKFLQRSKNSLSKSYSLHTKNSLEVKETSRQKQKLLADASVHKNKPCRYLSSNKSSVTLNNKSSIASSFTSHDSFLKSLIDIKTTKEYSNVKKFEQMQKNDFIVNSSSGQISLKLVCVYY